ncbi:lipid-binding SYLF domain-containing protein [Dyella sp. Tek66A03]|uniref:lipid-binding SYLF domain-containing protein n=1 Tax=Dyella sp. Tek66A03 TaxID=3458298 RepID=UPI0031B950E0
MFKPMRFAAIVPILLMVVASSSIQAAPFPADPPSSSKDQAKDAKLRNDSFAALNSLYASEPKAKEFAGKSKAILVFPNILKAGFMVGGQGGDGVLIERGKVVGKFNLSAASFGFQAGAQSFAQVMFFTTNEAVAYLDKSDGWSVGVGPSIVVMDQGMAKSATTQTLSSDVYVFIFGQRGLMGGAGVQGQKITRIGN